MKDVYVLVVVVVLILLMMLFSVVIIGMVPKIVNHTPKLTAKKTRKRQAEALNEIVKEWNELIIKDADRGKSGTCINYYSKSYSIATLERIVKYFRNKGFDVDYTSQSAHISWREEE